MKIIPFLIFLAGPLTLPASECAFLSHPTIILQTSHQTELVWEEPATLLDSEVPASQTLNNYQNWVSSRTNLRGAELLKNYNKIISSEIKKMETRNEQADFVESLKRNVRATGQIISGEVGKIRPINCVEALLFENLLGFSPQASQEFRGLVLKSSSDMIRIYFSFDRAGLDGGIATSEVFNKKIQSDLLQGWKIHLDLHNHPFSFENPYGDIGGNIAPSGADEKTYLFEKPEKAVITNGVDSAEFIRH